MNLGLTRKTVVVSGGARGIGQAISMTFAREGANVVAMDIDAESLVLKRSRRGSM